MELNKRELEIILEALEKQGCDIELRLDIAFEIERRELAEVSFDDDDCAGGACKL